MHLACPTDNMGEIGEFRLAFCLETIEQIGVASLCDRSRITVAVNEIIVFMLWMIVQGGWCAKCWAKARRAFRSREDKIRVTGAAAWAGGTTLLAQGNPPCGQAGFGPARA